VASTSTVFLLRYPPAVPDGPTTSSPERRGQPRGCAPACTLAGRGAGACRWRDRDAGGPACLQSEPSRSSPALPP